MGSQYQDEMIAQIHELMQQQNRILGAAHFTDRTHRRNPVPEPKRVPRPWVDHSEEEGPGDPAAEDRWEDDEEDPE